MKAFSGAATGLKGCSTIPHIRLLACGLRRGRRFYLVELCRKDTKRLNPCVRVDKIRNTWWVWGGTRGGKAVYELHRDHNHRLPTNETYDNMCVVVFRCDSPMNENGHLSSSEES